jgi:hypothetical protein
MSPPPPGHVFKTSFEEVLLSLTRGIKVSLNLNIYPSEKFLQPFAKFRMAEFRTGIQLKIYL